MNDFDVSPRSVARASWRWVPIAIAGTLLLALIVVGLWQAGWIFTNANIKRQAHAIQNGYANQSALRDQVTNGIADITSITTQIAATTGQEKAGLIAQRLSEGNAVCLAASQVNPAGSPLPAPQARWIRNNCSAGVVSPSSKLRKAHP